MKNIITFLKIALTIVAIVLIPYFVGYFYGKRSVKPLPPEVITEIRWEKGDTIRDTIKIPKPYEVIVIDSIPVPVPTDTAALYEVWKDYHLQRAYDLDFSNDSLGTFKVNAKVNKNKLVAASSTIVPIIKTVTTTNYVTKPPKTQIFGIIGSSADLKTNKIQLGLDIKQKYIIGVSGIRMNNQWGYTIDAGIKF